MMLIHLTPKFLCCTYSGYDVELKSACIPELGLALNGGVEIATRRPYPNKNYVVGCRKVGKKAIAGIFIQCTKPIQEFTLINTWLVYGEKEVVHTIKYQVQDSDYETVSDQMLLWHNMTNANKEYTARTTPQSDKGPPTKAQPRMGIDPNHARVGDFIDSLEDGMVVRRDEQFYLPTLQVERVLNNPYWGSRLPQLDQAFEARQ